MIQHTNPVIAILHRSLKGPKQTEMTFVYLLNKQYRIICATMECVTGNVQRLSDDDTVDVQYTVLLCQCFVLLQSAKMFNYGAGWKKTCDALFVAFAVVFLVTRLVIFPSK